MNISFIGSGRVATHLARAFFTQGFNISQIYSRELEHAQNLAKHVEAHAVHTLDLLVKADVYMIAVSDQAIESIVQQLSITLDKTALLVHTSGSTSMSLLTKYGLRAGVFYPLQTFSMERDVHWENIPLLLEADDQEDLVQLTELAKKLSTQIYYYDSEQRLSLHLAAVFANNFANYCFDIAKQTLDRNHVDFNLLSSLMKETVDKACEYDPKTVQTGPAKRHDQNILDAHQLLLQQQSQHDHLAVYQLLSQQIIMRHQT